MACIIYLTKTKFRTVFVIKMFQLDIFHSLII